MKATELKRGDQCPSCGAELRPATVPTDEQRRAAEDREKRQPLPFGADTANAEQRRELGELYVCDRCGYKTRFPLEEGEDGNGDQAASSNGELAESSSGGRSSSRKR